MFFLILLLLGCDASSLGSRESMAKKGRNLTSALIAIFISQSIIDISVPEISFAGHFFGFFWGVIISYGLYPKQNTQEQHVKEPLKKTDNEQKAS